MTGKTHHFGTIDRNRRLGDTDKLVLSGRDIVIARSKWAGGHDENNAGSVDWGKSLN